MEPMAWTQLAEAAAAAVAGAMATDAWLMVRERVSKLLAGGDPARERAVATWLDHERRALDAPPSGGRDAVSHTFEQRIGQALLDRLAADPRAAGELTRLVARLNAGPRAPSVRQQAWANGDGRVYQAGRDVYLSERPDPVGDVPS